KKSGIAEADQKQMLERTQAGATVIKNFVTWLKTAKSEKGRSFRLGKSLYDEKFENEIQSSFTAQQVFNAAVERKKYLHKQMIKISKELWPKYMGAKAIPADSIDMVAQVLDELSLKHTTPELFQSAIEKQIP